MFVYILRCSDNTFYTGWTVHLENRLKVHNEGKGSKYTRCRLPVSLVYSCKMSSKSLAMKREYAIKKLTRSQKEELIATIYTD